MSRLSLHTPRDQKVSKLAFVVVLAVHCIFSYKANIVILSTTNYASSLIKALLIQIMNKQHFVLRKMYDCSLCIHFALNFYHFPGIIIVQIEDFLIWFLSRLMYVTNNFEFIRCKLLLQIMKSSFSLVITISITAAID